MVLQMCAFILAAHSQSNSPPSSGAELGLKTKPAAAAAHECAAVRLSLLTLTF